MPTPSGRISRTASYTRTVPAGGVQRQCGGQAADATAGDE